MPKNISKSLIDDKENDNTDYSSHVSTQSADALNSAVENSHNERATQDK